MNGVKFGTIHSYDDLGLVLNSKIIGAANVKTQTIDVPGADGELDYTEYFGKRTYKNRTLSFEFSVIDAPNAFLSIYAQVQKLLNGRRMNIILDDDPGYYYAGRVTVNEWASNGRIGKIVIEVNADPYKLKTTETVVSSVATGATIITCQNALKSVIPTITVSGAATVTFGNYTQTLNANTATTYDEIVFVEGENVLTITPDSGTIAVTLEYQEGEL